MSLSSIGEDLFIRLIFYLSAKFILDSVNADCNLC